MSKELYNEEYLYREPSWLSKSGNMIMAGFLFCLILFSLAINYNQTIKAEILVTSENPPIHLVSKKTGHLSHLSIPKDNQVHTNDVLAVLNNSSSATDIFKLKTLLKDSINQPKELATLINSYPDDFVLEPIIQEAYRNLISKHTKLLLYAELDQNKKDVENIQSKLNQKRNIVRSKQAQLSDLRTSRNLSRSQYERSEKLFTKGVISKQQLEQFEQEYINAKNNVSTTQQELNKLYMDTLDLENKGFNKVNTDISENTLLHFDYTLARRELLSKINAWEELNVLKAPTNGIVSIFDIWTKNQQVNKGEKIFTIVPSSHGNIIGRCKVPINNSAKIKEGDQVVIKLDNYPSAEWGNLKGSVWKLSQAPKEGRQSYYSVYINLDNLKTTFEKEISFKQEMYGSATIILEKTSLFERVFYELRELWTNAKI